MFVNAYSLRSFSQRDIRRFVLQRASNDIEDDPPTRLDLLSVVGEKVAETVKDKVFDEIVLNRDIDEDCLKGTQEVALKLYIKSFLLQEEFLRQLLQTVHCDDGHLRVCVTASC